MKRFSLYCLPVLCAVTSPMFADGTGNSQQSPNQAPQAMKEITPPAYPLVKRSADPFLTAEYIYWRANQEGLNYATTGIAPGLASFHGKGKVHQPSFSYDSGFKVGFGLKFRHDSWDMLANYTWLFSNDNNNHAHRKNTQSMQNAWTLADDGLRIFADFAKARSEWSMHFNVLDLEMGRNYFISPRLTLRPHFGLKLAWIDQDMTVKYHNTDAVEFGASSPNAVTYKFDQDKFGVGIRAGFNTAWFMWDKWSVFGNFAATALYSDFDGKQKADFQSAAAGKVKLMDYDTSVHTVTPVLEFALGLRFETDFFRNNYQFMIQAGWEEQIWFNENQFTNLGNGSNGNLTIEGLTVKTGFYF